MTALELSIGSEASFALFETLRAQKPLVQCITNFVSMDIMANALLAIGASPAMVHCVDEVAAFQKIASALLVNVGTLSPDWVAGMEVAAKTANELKKPWVLDPVAAGATSFRTETIVKLAKLKPWVIRGNASEIMALAGAAGTTRGVDSTAESSEALEMGKQLALDMGTVVAISGKVDYVTDGKRVLTVSNGVKMLQSITAAGCALTALIAAFVSCAPDNPLVATAHALALFGAAAEVAEKKGGAAGPASLRLHLIDTLHTLSKDEVSKQNVQLHIEEHK